MGGAAGQAPQRLGKYTLLRPLATGGMAELFLARSDGIEGFSKLVVVKRILPHRAAEARFVRMFINEAKLVATLDHPNIAHVYDIGVDNNEYFFAMEYVHGQDVRRILQKTTDHCLRLDHALHIALGVCSGLHFAHEARDPQGNSLEIVHRDVNPQNVLVSYDGAVKLVDFGVAKHSSTLSETREGMVKGKYGYLSPEQALAEPLDRRSDVFALGILLWEMTVGRKLYKVNGELATLQRIVYVDPPRPSQFIADYPPDLEEIVMHALRRDRNERYQTAQALQVDLEAFAAAHQYVVSPIAMKDEMHTLFADRIEAWRAAERAGRSLADHIVELGSGERPSSTSQSGSGSGSGDISDVLQLLAEPTSVTQAARPSAPLAAQPGLPRAITMPPVAPRLAQSPAAQSTAQAPSSKRKWLGLGIAALALGGAAAVIATAFGGSAPNPVKEEPKAPLALASIMSDASATGPEAHDAAIAEVAADAPPVGAPPKEIVVVIPPPDDATTASNAPDEGSSGPGHTTSRHHNNQVRHHPSGHQPDASEDSDEPEHAGSAVEVVKPPVHEGSGAGSAIAAGSGSGSATVAIGHGSGSAAVPKGPAPGTVDAANIRDVFHSHFGEIQACVDRAKMDDRDLTGKFTLKITLNGSGQVQRATVSSATVDNHDLQGCMLKAVSRWTFAPPAGGVSGTFAYPVGF